MNPITAFRRKKGLSREQFAVLLAVGYWTLSRLERGVAEKVSSEVAKRLRELGYPGDPEADCLAWKEQFRKELLAEMKQ